MTPVVLLPDCFSAVVAIIDGTLYLVYAHNNYHLAPASILGKLYGESDGLRHCTLVYMCAVNSLLVLLNSRRRQVASDVGGGGRLWRSFSTSQSNGTSRPYKLPGSQPNCAVEVRPETTGETVTMVSFDVSTFVRPLPNLISNGCTI